MLHGLWQLLDRRVLCGAALLAIANLAQAQVSIPSAPPPTPILGAPIASSVPTTPIQTPEEKAAFRARIDQLGKQTQDLIDALKAHQEKAVPANVGVPESNTLSPLDVRQIINGYFAEKEQSQKTAEQAKAAEGYKVGSDLNMGISWGKNGVLFQTEHKDFWMHIGSRFQYDVDFFNQSTISRNKAPVGVSPYIDGNYFRRIRPIMEGGFWEVGEFNVELQLENISNGAVGLDDVWVGVKDIPFLGTVRAGHFHMPHGLEPDMYSSSRAGIFMERYSGNAAFLDQRGSGVLFTNAFFNERMTYAFMPFRPENANNGDDFANGDYGAVGRLSFLPIYEDEGRQLLHLAGSATWKHARPGTVTFAAGPQINDFTNGDNGYGNPVTVTTPGGPAAVTGLAGAPGNNTKWVSTGAVIANSSTVFGAEFLYIRGGFSLQAEYDWAFMNDSVVAGQNQGSLGYTAGYVQLSYILTGENRLYNKRLGRLPRDYLSQPNQPFWLVRDENGNFNWGLGSWEVAARFSRIDLNSGPIHGGVMDNTEVGLNWVPNSNIRIQFMYIHTDRFSMPANASGAWLNGFGIRTQLMF
jgi:phosphate-selective porin OprO/OprP